MGLRRFKREAPGHNEKPVVIAAYWKNVLDNHIDEVLGMSVRSYKSKSNKAVRTIRKCASHLDEVVKECGVASVVGGSAGVIGDAMAIGGVLAAPFTDGISLGLTFGGASLGVTGGVTSLTASLMKHDWQESDTERAKEATTAVVKSTQTFGEFMTICIHHFTQAREYLETENGKKFADLFNEAARNKRYTDIAHDAVKLSKKIYDGIELEKRIIAVIRFIRSGTYARAGLQTALAIQESAPGVLIGGRYIIMVGSTAPRYYLLALVLLASVSVSGTLWVVPRLSVTEVRLGNKCGNALKILIPAPRNCWVSTTNSHNNCAECLPYGYCLFSLFYFLFLTLTWSSFIFSKLKSCVL